MLKEQNDRTSHPTHQPSYAASAHPVFAALLRACTELEPPIAAAAFFSLTTLLRPYEIWSPFTTVVGGMMRVDASRTCGGLVEARVIPLSEVSVSVLSDRQGHLARLLCLPNGHLRDLSMDLVVEFEDVLDAEIISQACSLGLHQLAPIAIGTLVAEATNARQRAAVMAYAGIAPTGIRPTRQRLELEAQDLTGVARLIDELASAAGYVVNLKSGHGVA